MSSDRRRLSLSFLLSLLLHGLLLSLTFGGAGLGLPGFGLPWQERRAEAPDLHVLLVPAPAPLVMPAGEAPTEAAATVTDGATRVTIRHAVTAEPVPRPTVSPARIPTPVPSATPVPQRMAKAKPPRATVEAKVEEAAPAEPAPQMASDATPRKRPRPPRRPARRCLRRRPGRR